MSQSDPRAYLKLLWRWKFLFLLFVIGGPAVAFAVTSRQHKVYEASTLVQEGALPVDTSLFSANGGAAPAPSVATNPVILGGEARIIETPSVAGLAAPLLTPTASPNALLAHVTARADAKTGFITITAKAGSPRRTADIANAFGQAVVKLRTRQAVGELTADINRVKLQLARAPADDKVGRTQLSQNLQSLIALRAAQGSNAQVLQEATPSKTPVSPRIARSVILGLIAGLLVGLAAIFVGEAADRKLRQPDDVEAFTELPLLSVIPRSGFSPDTNDRRAREAFHMLRSALMFFNIDHPLSTVLVASPMKGDGKTTVATGLAVAAAQAGRDVILVEADLRRPRAASRLHVDPGDRLPSDGGLAAVLSAQDALLDALVEVVIDEPEGESPSVERLQGRLRLLPAGGTPPNPSELLASQRMRDILHELTELSDLVVIDSNPLLAVSDSLPLLDSASGVVLVVRLNHTTKDAIKRFQKTIANTSASVLGVVATGGASGIASRYGYGYGYGYGYISNGNANGSASRRRMRLPGKGKANQAP